MAPKKKKAGGGKKKKVTVDSEDLKSFNLAQRQVLVELLNRMQDLQSKNAELRGETKNMQEEQEHQLEEDVSIFRTFLKSKIAQRRCLVLRNSRTQNHESFRDQGRES